MVRRYMALNDDRYIVKVEVGEKLQGIEFKDIMEHSDGVQALLLQRGTHVIYDIAPGTLLQNHDILVIEGPVELLRKLSSRFIYK